MYMYMYINFDTFLLLNQASENFGFGEIFSKYKFSLLRGNYQCSNKNITFQENSKNVL